MALFRNYAVRIGRKKIATVLFAGLSVLALAGALSCAREKINIEKALVDKVIAEFTEERLAHYLRGGEPKANAAIFEKVLARHSLKLIDFRPAFRRFEPEIEARLLGEKK